MDRELFRFDERSYRPRRKTNYFLWSIVVLLLIGFAFAAWLGSFYIFGQPERPQSYRILQKLHKIDPPRRFGLTAAPKGEFLNAAATWDRYSIMRPAELAQANAELMRNFLRNYQQVRGLVPYVVGRYDVMEARELGPNDLFTSGVTALTRSNDRGEVLMEHVYPGDAHDVPLMKETLVVGLEIKLERTHDLSALVHVERLADGRILLSTVPLLYGSYTVTRGPGTFSLEPPDDLNIAAGWPIFKDSYRRKAEIHYANYRAKTTPALNGSFSMTGVTTSTPPPAENELVRVEQAIAPNAANPKVAQKSETPAAAPSPASTKLARQQNTPKAAPSASPVVVAKVESTPGFSPPPTVITEETPVPVKPAEPIAAAAPTPTPVPVRAAVPLTAAEENALASTAGGASWKTFEAGHMPAGRLVSASDLDDVAKHGLSGERYYLRGQFVVNFAETNRAVLRPRSASDEESDEAKSVRIIVEFPAGSTPPAQGAVVNRDQLRPYEITDVRRQSDGQINVFAREIMRP